MRHTLETDLRQSRDKIGIILTALILLLWGCSTLPDASNADNKLEAIKKFEAARRFEVQKDRGRMLASLVEAVRLDPDNLLFRLTLGMTYFVNNDGEKAEKEFGHVLKIDPNSKDALRMLGRLAMGKADWAQAAHYFEEDLRRPGTPLPHQVYNWLAYCYQNLKRYDEAEQKWLQAIDIGENAGIRYNLGLAYLDREKFDKAMESMKKAVDLNPDFTQAHYEMALLYMKKQKLDKATEHLKDVIRLAPDTELARLSQEYLKLINSK
ncbi:MAG: hypothetical protein COV67_14860 [Nitrospinae bacterium CG11_big_fil_rev_8_21_14_0_20_56_8]|nr:MAG: hypothetical protein COV67_14860 [Nitrospinae bacterium CG11_big_fil_rev_8_21_14_0_20_56_8]